MLTRIKEVRIEKGVSQQELAEKAGVTQAAISYIEAGKRPIDLEFIEKISKILKCKPYELLPLEWQPETISEADLQILRSIKSYATDKQNEEKAKNSQIQKESER